MDIDINAIMHEMNLTVWVVFLTISLACGYVLDALFGHRSPGIALSSLMCVIGCVIGFGAFIHFKILVHLPLAQLLAGATSGLFAIMIVVALLRRGVSN